MRLDTGLFQQQTQKQILSPQMIQSMEILVLNQQQLEERINDELESNVALERSEAGEAGESTDGGSSTEIEIETDGEIFDLDQTRSEVDELVDLGRDTNNCENFSRPISGRNQLLPESLLSEVARTHRNGWTMSRAPRKLWRSI